jgi:hypothetical protein
MFKCALNASLLACWPLLQLILQLSSLLSTLRAIVTCIVMLLGFDVLHTVHGGCLLCPGQEWSSPPR